MKTQSLIVASALVIGSFSTQVNAQESGLEKFVGHMLSQAVQMTSNEISQGVQQVVANTSHMFELDGKAVSGSVSVTDIAKTESKKAKSPEQVITE